MDATSLGDASGLRPRGIRTDVRIEAVPDAVTASAGIGAFALNNNGALSSLKAFDQLHIIEATSGIFKPVQRLR